MSKLYLSYLFNINLFEIMDGGYIASFKKINNDDLDLLNRTFNRDIAFDDDSKQKKTGIYRIRYEDKNDIDKKGIPKIKFNYYYQSYEFLRENFQKDMII